MAINGSFASYSNLGNISYLNITEPEDVFFGKRTELLIWQIILGVVSIIGAFLNTIVLIAAWPRSSRKSSFALLICHFVFLDLWMCLFNIPTYVFMVRARMDGRWVWPNACHYVQSLFSITSALINWSDAGMAFNRTIALFFPLHYRFFTTKTANILILGVGWVASVTGVLIGPIISGFPPVMRLTAPGYCSFSPTAAGSAGTASMGLLTIAPYSITGIGAILILLKSSFITYRSGAIRPSMKTQDGPSKALQYRLKMARMLLLTFLWTALCSAPGYVGVYCFPKVLAANPISALWFRVSQPFQYGLTPCVLLMFNDEYRKRLMSIFFKNSHGMLVSRAPISNTAGPRPSHQSGLRADSTEAKDAQDV